MRKTQPSAFFGTNLAAWYISKGVDTVIVTGCTTSGCVRASVIDSMSYNFRTVVVSDCVGDRALGPHKANLFDMEQKYADLMTFSEIIAILDERVPRIPRLASDRIFGLVATIVVQLCVAGQVHLLLAPFAQETLELVAAIGKGGGLIGG